MDRFDFALSLSEKVSAFLREECKKKHEITSKNENDYVTDSDKKAEMIIRSEIEKEYPDDEIIGEEYGVSGQSDSVWIIDPIDGTVDFMNSFPLFSVSIAYKEKGELIFGVVSIPMQKEVFYAKRGSGSYLNGKKIVSSTIKADKALAIMVPPHRHHEHLDSYIKEMRRLYEVYSDMRSLGSAAVSLCYLASGRVSCYYEKFLKIYDVAAGIVIAGEAGCEISLEEENDNVNIIATANGLMKITKEKIDG